MNLASLYEADRERFPTLAKLEKHGIAVGAYLRMIDGVYAALEGVEEHWGMEYDGDYLERLCSDTGLMIPRCKTI